MKTLASTLLATLALAATGSGASTFVPGSPVDWLTLDPSGDLLDDNGAAGASLNVTTTAGILLPTTPARSDLGGPFWSADPPVLDSILGDHSVPAFEVRVVPFNNLASFRIELAFSRPLDVLVAVGELLSDPTDATDAVEILAGAASEVQFLGTFGWNNGLQSFDQDLQWDPATRRLSSVPGANGDSQVAFFEVSGTDRITFDLPSAYGAGTGDSIHLAIGIIPEPSSALLLLAGAPLFLLRRRRV